MFRYHDGEFILLLERFDPVSRKMQTIGVKPGNSLLRGQMLCMTQMCGAMPRVALTEAEM